MAPNVKSSGDAMDVDKAEVDEELYSRQLYVLGKDAHQKMSQSNVLIVGMSGLGAEVAKDIILSGVKSVTMHDTVPVTYMDLGTHFYLTAKDLGQNRSACCIDKFSQLNPYVACRASTSSLTEEFLSNFNVVVIVNHPSWDKVEELNEVCREKGIHFIAAETRGVFGFVFVDLGDKFTVTDPTGQDPVRHVITEITPLGEVFVDTEGVEQLGLYKDDVVEISYVEGMPGLDTISHRIVEVTGRHSFKIGSVSGMGSYVRGGYLTQVIPHKEMEFLPLKSSLPRPDIMMCDFDMERPHDLHVSWQALHRWSSSHEGALPRSYNAEDATEILAIAKEMHPAINSRVVTLLAYTARGCINPMCAFIGGVVAQEVLKSVSGKFTPIHQWLHFDAIDSLPEGIEDCKEELFASQDNRYDSQSAVFGKPFHDKLKNLNYFLVGAGALGCEFLKNFALMGIGTGPKGSVTVTDNDSIEVSNLSRQFLFRREHVGKPKSSTAASAAKAINPLIKVRALSQKVGPDTEDVFDDRFWERLDGVCNALDNVAARLYVDSCCITHRVPLLESGTLGASANCQVVIPMMTESYGTQRDPEETSIPMCTLHYFPNTIDHCIHYARSLFDEVFFQSSEGVNALIDSPDEFFARLDREPGTKLQTLEKVHAALVKECPLDFIDCLRWARLRFEELFNWQIQQLLHVHPLDKKTKDGKMFWSGSKKPPTALLFNAQDSVHLEFVRHAATLYASIYSISYTPRETNDEAILILMETMEIPAFTPKDLSPQELEKEKKDGETTSGGHDEDTSDEERAKEDVERMAKEKCLTADLQEHSKARSHLCAVKFEKDDPHNGHIDFIAAASTLRARNYGIPEADKMHIKRISGNIVPAMVTTTALITGLVCLQLYRVVLKKPLESHRNAFVNLGLPMIVFSEPRPSPRISYLSTKESTPKPTDPSTSSSSSSASTGVPDPLEGKYFTLWDYLDMNFGKDVQLNQFLQSFTKKYHMVIVIMSYNSVILYNKFQPLPDITMEMPLTILLAKLAKAQLTSKKYVDLVVNCDSMTGKPLEVVPPVRYRFKSGTKPKADGGSGKS